MTEDEARKVWEAVKNNEDICNEKLRQLHRWIKKYAITQLRVRLNAEGIRNETLEYILLMARCNFSSVETDNFLIHHKCYPEWM